MCATINFGIFNAHGWLINKAVYLKYCTVYPDVKYTLIIECSANCKWYTVCVNTVRIIHSYDFGCCYTCTVRIESL